MSSKTIITAMQSFCLLLLRRYQKNNFLLKRQPGHSRWVRYVGDDQEAIKPLERGGQGARDEQTYPAASVFCTGFQERVMVLLYEGGLWKRSCGPQGTK